MERDMWDYFVGLRQDVINATTGIRDAGFSLFWDDTTPNYATRRRLREILDQRTQQAAKFGVLVVTRHTDCGRTGHYKNADKNGYLTTNPYGMDIRFRDKRFVWDRDQLYQGSRLTTCPCSDKSGPVEHHVIEDVVYEKGRDLQQCKVIYNVLSDLESAVGASGDKQPRSGIREYLLRAIIQLNDAILPVGVDAHIKAQAPAASS